MVDLKISFSKYDYFGIILPGIVLLTVFMIIIPFDYYLQVANDLLSLGDLKFAFIFLIGILIIVVSYILGTITSSLGKGIIEDIIIKKKLGYPSKNLFNLKKPQENDENSKNRRKNRSLFKSYKTSYSCVFINKFNSEFQSYFGHSLLGNDIDKFKLCHTVVKENCPVTFGRLNTFISLYGLSRNFSISFLAISPFILFKFILSVNFWYLLFFIFCPFLSFYFFMNFLKFFRIFADEVFRSFYVFILEKKHRGNE